LLLTQLNLELEQLAMRLAVTDALIQQMVHIPPG
jgi:hypothetical protein